MNRRYEALDGLRGVAALGVLGSHIGDSLNIGFLFPRGYLAVDFFFVLSGFIIANRYEGDLRRGGYLLEFAKRRAARLLPLIILGTALGAGVALAKWKMTGFPAPQNVAIAASLGAFVLPCWLAVSLHPVLFPLNIPEWSLFFEVIANAAYALTARWLTRWALPVVVLIGAVGLAACAPAFGALSGGGEQGTWIVGLARVTFSFFLGVLFRRLPIRFRIPSWGAALILLVTFSIPRSVIGWPYDLACIVVVLPLVVAGATNAKGGALSELSGRLSYPLYTTHYPFGAIIANLARSHHFQGAQLAVVVVLEATVAVSFAFPALWGDEFAQKWLKRRGSVIAVAT